MDGHELSKFIEQIGIPLFVALALGGCAWWLLKYILNTVVERITESERQIEADIQELKAIIVQLIDSGQMTRGDLIRLDTFLRIQSGLDPDFSRITRSPADQNGKTTKKKK